MTLLRLIVYRQKKYSVTGAGQKFSIYEEDVVAMETATTVHVSAMKVSVANLYQLLL